MDQRLLIVRKKIEKKKRRTQPMELQSTFAKQDLINKSIKELQIRHPLKKHIQLWFHLLASACSVLITILFACITCKDSRFKVKGHSRSWFCLMPRGKEEEKTKKLCNFCWCAESQRNGGCMVQLAKLPRLGAITHLHCIHSRVAHFTSCFPSTNTFHCDRAATQGNVKHCKPDHFHPDGLPWQ